MQDPRQVFLFSGHMIDGENRARDGRPDRKPPRFPSQCEPTVARDIDLKLTELHAGENDLGITQGACGGDLLFAEAMLRRGASLELHLPFEEQAFLDQSVDFRKASSTIADRWRDRFLAVRNHPSVRIRILPAEPAAGLPEDVFERCNLWMLDRAASFGADKVCFICLWNGEGGDGPGGTQHMREAVRQRGGTERWIDIRKLCGEPQSMRSA